MCRVVSVSTHTYIVALLQSNVSHFYAVYLLDNRANAWPLAPDWSSTWALILWRRSDGNYIRNLRIFKPYKQQHWLCPWGGQVQVCGWCQHPWDHPHDQHWFCSLNTKPRVPSDLPEQCQWIPAENLKTKQYLKEIITWTRQKSGLKSQKIQKHDCDIHQKSTKLAPGLK